MTDEPNKPDEPNDAAPNGFGGIVLVVRKRWWLLAGAGLSLLATILGCWLFFLRSDDANALPGAAEVLVALAEGEDSRAESLAQEIASRPLVAPKDRSAAEFVLGVVGVRRAERMLGGARSRFFRQAAEHLAQAAAGGFPPHERGRGLFLLGKALLASGRIEASRVPLEQALTAGADRLATQRLLAEAYMRSPRADQAKALSLIDAYLNEPALDDHDRLSARLLRAEILLRAHKLEECQEALAALAGLVEDADVGLEARLIDARLLIERGRQEREAALLARAPDATAKAESRFQDAIDKLRKIQADAPSDHDAVAISTYLIGVCFSELGDVRAALDQFERVHSRYVESPEGWAALLEIGSIYAQRRDDERALQAFIDATRLYAHLDSDSNPWISNEELRDRLVKAYGLFLDHGAFSYAIALAEAISPPVTVEDSWELAAKAYQAWGRKLIADASGLGAADAAAQKRQGRARLRSAAKLFNQLAEKRFATRFYPSDRWNCATCYMEGQNYTAAVYYLDEYLARAPRRDRPSGLLALGRALLALGEYEQSVQVLRECIEFHPKHPAQFEARIVRGAAFLELGELDQAAESLRGNLEGDLLTPSSKEWRESLFALARLYHAAGRYDEALARLNEAIERYPDDHQVLEARYLVADSLFQLAARYGKQMEDELVEETRRHLSALRRKSYEQAVVRYEQFLEQLRDRESASELTAAQRAMQRASRLNHAAALVALERYPQAVEALGSVLARYPNAPECIAAYVQLAECHRRLGNPEEVKTALALGKVALDRIGDTLPWIERTGLSRDRWASYLTWLQTL